MQKNDLLKCEETILRVLEVKEDKAFVINCCKRTVPYWVPLSDIQGYTEISEAELLEHIPIHLPDIDTLDANSRRVMNKRFTWIANILPVVCDFHRRNHTIAAVSREKEISRQTVINYLCLYLAYQNKAVLAPKPCISDTTLTRDEKNFRWALNKFHNTKNKHSPRAIYGVHS